MPRLRLTPLKHYSFTTHCVVRTTDLNYGGHLGNDRLLALVHEARVAYLNHHGWSEKACGGVSLILGDVAIVYQNEAFAGDELVFDVAAGEPGNAGFRLFFRVFRPVDGKDIALVENGMVCYDYETGKVQPLPEKIRSVISKSE